MPPCEASELRQHLTRPVGVRTATGAGRAGPLVVIAVALIAVGSALPDRQILVLVRVRKYALMAPVWWGLVYPASNVGSPERILTRTPWNMSASKVSISTVRRRPGRRPVGLAVGAGGPPCP